MSYVSLLPEGLKPDVLFCYDLELPADFQPRPQDGEVRVLGGACVGVCFVCLCRCAAGGDSGCVARAPPGRRMRAPALRPATLSGKLEPSERPAAGAKKHDPPGDHNRNDPAKQRKVEEFMLWDLDKVAHVIAHTDDYKPNCGVVVMDFLARHGYLAPDAPGYAQLLAGMRQGDPR